MVIKDELKRQQQKIFFFNSYVQKLCVKIYYEKNKNCDNEYKRNETELSILSAEAKLNKIQITLDYLLSEYQESMTFYVNLCKEEKNE